MAINPNIALQVKSPDIGRSFNNALLNVQRLQGIQQQKEEAPIRSRLLSSQAEAAETASGVAANRARIESVALGAAEILPELNSGNVQGALVKLNNRRQRLIEQDRPTETTDAAIATLQQDGGLQQLLNESNQVINVAQQAGIFKAPSGSGGLASAKTEILPDGSVVQALPDGGVQVRNPMGEIVEGQARTDVLKQSQQAGLDIKQQEADIAVRQAERTAGATQRAKRVSEVTKEMTSRNREAKRGEINLAQAATLIEKATQGIEGVNKVRLAKVFPGIDVSNEAALSQSLTNLALDQLQKFKGPTTDFEFGKTEEIAGTLGDSKTANRAKVASLQRNNWFIQKESRQFQQHVKNGGDPDSFSFNFGEPIKTKRGVFTLKDLQDTAVANNISIDDALKRLNK